MTEPLPFGDKQYDAVMSNVAAHMFSDEVTRRLLAEVKRVLRYGGPLLLHVNSDADRELRAPRRPVKLELEPNYVLEESGQTVRFFSHDYLRSVLADWSVQELAHVEIPNSATGRPFKRVWRIVATSESPRSDRTGDRHSLMLHSPTHCHSRRRWRPVSRRDSGGGG